LVSTGEGIGYVTPSFRHRFGFGLGWGVMTALKAVIDHGEIKVFT
jgi:hypothetical protein